MPPQRMKLTPSYIEQRSIPEPNSGCWIWLGSFGNGGYGIFNLRGYKRMNASRASYIAYFGMLPKGIDVDHLCHFPLCVNPDHLKATTHKENCQNRKRNVCANGHKFDGVNSRGHRFCKTCANLRARKYRAALAQAKGDA